MAVFYYRHRDFFGTRSDAILKSLGQSLLLNVIFGASSANIDNWCGACKQWKLRVCFRILITPFIARNFKGAVACSLDMGVAVERRRDRCYSL